MVAFWHQFWLPLPKVNVCAPNIQLKRIVAVRNPRLQDSFYASLRTMESRMQDQPRSDAFGARAVSDFWFCK